MRRACLVSLALLPAVAMGEAEPCRPIGGLTALLRPGAVLLLGEIHGTVEGPGFAGEVACHAAAAGLPVVVGLELEVGGQARVDAILDSGGGETARAALLTGPDWQREYQDGRNSRAMLELIERLGRLRRGRAAVRVVLFDPGTAGGGQARDRGMARLLAEAVAGEAEALTVVLTGNLHSRTSRGRPGNADYAPMGYLLARALGPGRIVSLDQAHGGGTAWICAPACGVAALGGRRGERPWAIEIGDEGPSGHDGWYRVGRITASPPARFTAPELLALEASPSTAAAPEARPAEPRWDEAPPPPEPTGPLSPAERSLQGLWEGFDHRQGFRTWNLRVEGRAFRAEGSGDWYEGRLVVRADREPAWIDFVIERCRCAYEGDTSRALYRWDGLSLIVAAPEPGSPRPARFDAGAVQLLRFVPAGGL